jgi:hypothetical protein
MTELVTEMPRCFSTSIQSDVACRELLRALTVPPSGSRRHEQQLLGQRRFARVRAGNDGERPPARTSRTSSGEYLT